MFLMYQWTLIAASDWPLTQPYSNPSAPQCFPEGGVCFPEGGVAIFCP